MRKINLVLGIVLVLCFVSNVEGWNAKGNEISDLDLYYVEGMKYPQKELIHPFLNKKITDEEFTDFMLKHHLSQLSPKAIYVNDDDIPMAPYYKQPDDTLVNKIVIPIKNIVKFTDALADNHYYCPILGERMDYTEIIETKAEMEALENRYYSNKSYKDIYTKDQSLKESPIFLPPELWYNDDTITLPSYPKESKLNAETLTRINKSRELATGDKESISMKYWDQDISVPVLRYYTYDSKHPFGHYENEGGRVVRSFEIIRDVNNQPEHSETDSWVEFGGVHKGRDYFILNNLPYNRFHDLYSASLAPYWVRSEPELFIQLSREERQAGYVCLEERRGTCKKGYDNSKDDTPVDLETVKKAAELDAYKEIKYRSLFHQALKENPEAADKYKAQYGWNKSRKEWDRFVKSGGLADALYESSFKKTSYSTNIGEIDFVFTGKLLDITHYDDYYFPRCYRGYGCYEGDSTYHPGRTGHAGGVSGFGSMGGHACITAILGPMLYGDTLTEKLLGLAAAGKRISPGLLIGVASGKEMPGDISNNIIKESDTSKAVNVDDDTFWLFQLLKDGYNYAVDKLTGGE